MSELGLGDVRMLGFVMDACIEFPLFGLNPFGHPFRNYTVLLSPTVRVLLNLPST